MKRKEQQIVLFIIDNLPTALSFSPLIFLQVFNIFYSHRNYYIPEIKFFMPSLYVLKTIQVFIGLSFTIISFLKINEIFDGFTQTLAMCLLAAELTMLAIFAQYHFGIAVIFLILCIFSSLLFYISVKILIRKRKLREMRKYKDMIFRFNLKAYAVILLPALVFGIYYSDMPLVQPSVDAVNMSMKPSEDNNNRTVYEEHIKQIDMLDADEWKEMSVQKKIDILQILVNVEITYLSINPTKICGEKLSGRRMGEYDCLKELICVDYEYLKSAPLEDCIGTVYHEVRHAYQNFIIDMIDWNSEEAHTAAFYNEAREWKKEKETYIDIDTTKDFSKYYCQKQEQDARAYASERRALMVDYIKSDKKN